MLLIFQRILYFLEEFTLLGTSLCEELSGASVIQQLFFAPKSQTFEELIISQIIKCINILPHGMIRGKKMLEKL